MTNGEFKAAPIKPAITVAELERIDVRVGTIVSVEDVSGSDKLVRLVVDFGDHQRNVLAGMKQERTDVSAIAGTQALFVVNLEPKKMMGDYLKECFSTLVTWMASNRCWLSLKAESRMEREQDETRSTYR